MYTIKEASSRSGVPVATIRAWERRYRAVEPARTASGYRLYDDEAVDRLVAQDERRLLGEDLGDRHPLLLAARQRVRTLPGAGHEADVVEAGQGHVTLGVIESPHERGVLPPAGHVRQPSDEDVVQNPEPLDEVELLVDDSDARAVSAQRGPPQGREVLPAHPDRAVGGHDGAGEQA